MESDNTPREGRAAQWTEDELRQLGRTPDSVLARRLGRTIQEVAAERVARRIGLAKGGRRWTEREVRLLGTMADQDVGQRLRRPRHEVRKAAPRPSSNPWNYPRP